MDFRTRLQRATERGQRSKDEQLQKEREAALSEEECKRLHSNYRLQLLEHLEACLKQLADNFPGFRFRSIVDETGWGAEVARDDLQIVDRKRASQFSRLRLIIAPYSSFHVLSIDAKGTIENKESFARSHYQQLNELDETSFRELIELWVLDYAEEFAGK